MKTYKHYSFDLWMTLIRSNPSFKEERTKFFYDNYNTKNKPLEDIAAIFRQTDLLCNAINEKTGSNIDSEEMYLMVIAAINDSNELIATIDTVQLYATMEAIVFRHLPQLYDSETLSVLMQLKQNSNSTFSLLSNTAFIKGRTLREVLKRLGLDGFFDFQLYSDETGMSKPNKEFFQLLLTNATALQKSITAADIIHIGDNEKADIEGAKAAGIQSLLVNSNHKSITTLLNYD